MSRARQTAFDTVAHALWMFASWAMARIALSMYMRTDINYGDVLLSIVSDVEIHSLHFRWGWDFAALLFSAAIVAIVQTVRRRRVLVPTTVSAALAGVLSFGMVMYPALTLSGRMSSPFTGVDRSVNESVAFAVVATVVLVGVMTLLALAQREEPPARPPSQA